MTIQRINLSKTYVQDEHQRNAQAIQNAVDMNATQITALNNLPSFSTGTYKTEIRLGFVYMQSVSAGGSQQCVETITYANGTGSTARAYMATMPFSGSVVGIAIDINPSIATVQNVMIYKNGAQIITFPVASSASNGSTNFAKGKYPFNVNDYFFGGVTYTTAVNQGTCSFIKLYVELGT